MTKTAATRSLAMSRRGVLQAVGTIGLGAALMTPAEHALASAHAQDPDSVKLNVLFIGAHPDDENGSLATLGQWNEYHGVEAGVITITRGEGGGNAVGLEEGPPLGRLREAEERTAVGRAGVRHVFNLDEVDFYYTASAPLSREVWGGDALLGRIIRVIRATRPEIILTMNPSAVEGNHGNHQQAAMYAVEAYLKAGDPSVFPEHVDEGFAPWTPRRILRVGANGEGATGADAVKKGFVPTIDADLVFGAWDGTYSEREGRRWSAVRDDSVHDYVTQGWHLRPPSPSDPAEIRVNWLTVIHSKSPLSDPRSGDAAALEGAVTQSEGGLPLGLLLEVKPETYEFVAGEARKVAVRVTAPPEGDVPAAPVSVVVPKGWKADPAELSMPALRAGEVVELPLTVRASKGDSGETGQIWAELALPDGTAGKCFAPVRRAGALEASIAPLEEIADFREWTKSIGMRHLDALVPELFSVPQGWRDEEEIVVESFSSREQRGRVSVQVPAGFSVEPDTVDISSIEPRGRESFSVWFENVDTSIPFGNRAENGGSWPVPILTESAGAVAVRNTVMNLVPTSVVPKVEPPKALTGVLDPAVFPGEDLPVDTVWQGTPMGGTTETISGTSRISHDGENLYVFVSVQDDVRGTILPPEDNKRQRRTDSVEIYVDPRGTAPNTAHTFIAGIMPSMGSMTGAPGVGRDRDNHQGEASETAPGMEVAVVMAETEKEYTGYDLEVKIPFVVLPDAIDPEHMGFNVVINDSDTQDKTAQDRVGWSTFPGMRADPWRWGLLRVEGLSDGGSNPKDPILPRTAALSIESPQSIIQSAADGVPLGGAAPARGDLRVDSAKWRGKRLVAKVRTPSAGEVRAFLWGGESVAGSVKQKVKNGKLTISLPTEEKPDSGDYKLLVSYIDSEGRVAAAVSSVS
ncbi:PIG-L family deacetylase [Helcobacillus sp. ACRRO]|uniref:PIG-L family deacetylase n=1 Tax=Helcobacillus sp. ACRRO TaxID=2918202 RepID=UPI001EF6585B|nr:PIG-L family deacetylase [Helcobacillus sp. ACRRO]MCG7427882.1 PIG-L family deacetylase [Helcobacillus sp. ACRRO]